MSIELPCRGGGISEPSPPPLSITKNRPAHKNEQKRGGGGVGCWCLFLHIIIKQARKGDFRQKSFSLNL